MQTSEAHPGVGTILLDRSPTNAFTRQVRSELAEAAREASAREDIKAVVLYGGPKVLGAGDDVAELTGLTAQEVTTIAASMQSDLATVAQIPKPTVAAITGYAVGGGLELALCADRRVAGDNVKVSLPEVLIGLMSGGGATQRLSRLIGPSRAKDLIFTGRFVDAEEARSIGLVDEVVAPDDVYEAALTWAAQFTGSASVAIAAAKAAIDQGMEVDLNTGLDIESGLFASLFATEDCRIGMQSLIENGPGAATFIGR